METINSWNEIKWTIVDQTVFRLQLRIYKAATEKKLEKMYKLQKTLVSSKFAKYLAVRRVTQDNTRGIPSPKEKFDLANKLLLKGTSSPIKRTYLVYPSGKRRPLSIPTIENGAKQMVYKVEKAYNGHCARLVEIKVIDTKGDLCAVESQSLNDGDYIISEGMVRRDGVQVYIKEILDCY